MTGKGYSFDREKIHLNLARLKKYGEIFEIVINPDLAVEYKSGKNISLNDVLKDEFIFSDARKALKASEHRLKEVFGTDDPIEIAKVILTKGEIQETSEYRAKLVEEKRKKIIDMIHRYGDDPKTHLPHPITRIEAALEEAKVKIDARKSAEEQIDEIIKQLRPILAIKIETKQMKVRITSQYAQKSYPIVKSFGKILKDTWLDDGSWQAVVEIPAGLEIDFYDKLNTMTHGNVETEVIATK